MCIAPHAWKLKTTLPKLTRGDSEIRFQRNGLEEDTKRYAQTVVAAPSVPKDHAGGIDNFNVKAEISGAASALFLNQFEPITVRVSNERYLMSPAFQRERFHRYRGALLP